jgi:hypothetical protein
MSKHPDVVVGSANAEDGTSIQVMVTGVDVRLDVRRPDHEPTVVLLAPDEAIDLVSLLQRALETE